MMMTFYIIICKISSKFICTGWLYIVEIYTFLDAQASLAVASLLVVILRSSILRT